MPAERTDTRKAQNKLPLLASVRPSAAHMHANVVALLAWRLLAAQ